MDLLPARPRPLTGVPLERGRARRRSATTTAAVLRVRVLERRGPDPQGADLRADRRPRATTARTPRSTGGTWTPRRRHSWMRWRYAYPQAAFPYEDLIEVNDRRARTEPEYELLDTGVFDARLLGRRGRVRQGRRRRHLHPAVRSATPGRSRRPCTCCRRCGSATPGPGIEGAAKPSITSSDGGSLVEPSTSSSGRSCSAGDGDAAAAVLRQRDQHRAGSGAPTRAGLPQGRDQRSRRHRRGDRQPGRGRGPRRRCTTS